MIGKYLICDSILWYQIFYYRWAEAHSKGESEDEPLDITPASETERMPLLAAKDADLSASHWKYTKTLAYISSVVFVITVGILAWTFSGGKGSPRRDQDVFEWKSQAFGWLSASLYSTFSVFF